MKRSGMRPGRKVGECTCIGAARSASRPIPPSDFPHGPPMAAISGELVKISHSHKASTSNNRPMCSLPIFARLSPGR
jgi:hypothetical protein